MSVKMLQRVRSAVRSILPNNIDTLVHGRKNPLHHNARSRLPLPLLKQFPSYHPLDLRKRRRSLVVGPLSSLLLLFLSQPPPLQSQKKKKGLWEGLKLLPPPPHSETSFPSNFLSDERVGKREKTDSTCFPFHKKILWKKILFSDAHVTCSVYGSSRVGCLGATNPTGWIRD